MRQLELCRHSSTNLSSCRYTVVGDRNEPGFPQYRDRWVHAHPTWTFYAIPFVADGLLSKLSFEKWAKQPRVIKAIAEPKILPNPDFFMNEDEDLFNIMLWRYRKHKQWSVIAQICVRFAPVPPSTR